jgi:hypothetical protein
MTKIYVLFVAFFLAGTFLFSQNAAIPNSGFETWTHGSSTVGYDDATGWNDLNSTTAGFGKVTCYKATAAGDFHNGAAAMKLSTANVLGQNANGIATTGNINTSSQAITGGIAYTGRPDSIIGWYKSTPVSTDHGFIQLLLTGSSNTDTIGFAHFNTPSATVGSYIRFSSPVKYKSANPVVTSQWILSSSAGNTGQQVGATIYVDDLDFVFNPAGIREDEQASGFHIGPNPANNILNVFNNELRPASLEVYEISGRKVASRQLTGSITNIDLSTFSPGSYLYTIFDEAHKPVCNGKIIVQH